MSTTLSTNPEGVNDVPVLASHLWHGAENLVHFQQLLTSHGVEFTVGTVVDGSACVDVVWGSGECGFAGGMYFYEKSPD